jgi:hypothetical protein
MDRPRRRRRDPERTGPIRNSGEALRDEPRRSAARSWEDAASSGVREGYRVIDEQIRRGRRMAQELEEDDDRFDPRRGGRRQRTQRTGGARLVETQMRHIGLLMQEILRQLGSARPDPWRLSELVFRLYIESITELTRFGFDVLGGLTSPRRDRFDEDVAGIGRDFEESYSAIEEEDDEEIDWDEEDAGEWDWSSAPSAPTVIRSTVPIPVHVSAHKQTEIDLDLPAGSQSLELEVEPPPASSADTPALPAFEAEIVELPNGPAILRIEVPRELPDGHYRRRILIRATGEPAGNLTVQVGTVPKTGLQTAPKTGPKTTVRTNPTSPKARKR